MTARQPLDRWLVAVLAVFVLGATFVGWRAFWFLTDDAFILYRYASNLVTGHGLVWNPEPFRPVEGYTSALWVLILSTIWWLTGLEPPETSNWLSLLFGYGTLAVGVRIVWRMELPPFLERHRSQVVLLVVLGTITNRTFLTWLSSGLETALFNFLLTSWLCLVLELRENSSTARVALLCTAVGFMGLTRPDGLLFLAATVALLALGPERRWRGAATAPLAVIPLHVLARKIYYGEWLPNTYYAKYISSWPESGLRYFASYSLEYGTWLLYLLAVVYLARRFRSGGPSRRWRELAAPGIGIGALLAHVGYYTLIIGGDHFEYRVYSHLVLLSWCAAVWLMARLCGSARGFAALALAMLLVSWPIGWVHWLATRHLEERAVHLFVPIAERFPAPLAPVVAIFDRWQGWLIGHSVGMRHQEHKQFWREQVRRYPTREEGRVLDLGPNPAMPTGTVGVPAWVLPHVAILDMLGLNDYAIARGATRAMLGEEMRQMAHDRIAPRGYVACFRPNVQPLPKPGGAGGKRSLLREGWERRGKLLFRQRGRPLTGEDIRACEARFGG